MTTTGHPRFGQPSAGPGRAGSERAHQGTTHPGAGAAQAVVPMLRSALADLAADTGGSAVGPDRVERRLERRPECRTTRAALHDYLHKRLVPGRRRRVEVHLDRCAECTRAFIDVREDSWARRPRTVAGPWLT